MSIAYFEERIRAAIKADRFNRKRRTVDDHTIGDLCNAVMSIDNAADARRFYEGCVDWTRVYQDAHPLPAGEAPYKAPEVVAKANIGWWFGDGMPEERIRMWVQACGAAHPVFGTYLPTTCP